MKFIFNHTPISKKRHRSTRSGRTYDPQEKEKNSIKQQMKNEIEKFIFGDENQKTEACETVNSKYIHCCFVFEIPIPMSDSEVIKNYKRWSILKPNVKPDLDNLEKFYLDCANEIFFTDDKVVISCLKKKIYSTYDNPRVIMNVESVKDQTKETSKEVLKLISPQEVRELMKGCYSISQLPLSQFEVCETDEAKSAYADKIAYMILNFSNEWSSQLTKIKNRCK